MVQISGNTYPCRDRIKALGGVWNREHCCWIVPDAAADECLALVVAAGPRPDYPLAKTPKPPAAATPVKEPVQSKKPKNPDEPDPGPVAPTERPVPLPPAAQSSKHVAYPGGDWSRTVQVHGKTFEHNHKLRNLNGRWCPPEKCWLVDQKHAEKVVRFGPKIWTIRIGKGFCDTCGWPIHGSDIRCWSCQETMGAPGNTKPKRNKRRH